MATTDGRLALAAARAVLDSNVTAAVLHGGEKLLAERVTSDVDLVADRPLADVVQAVRETWKVSGLYPVVVWPYDVGGTGTVFLANQDASQGVQIDVLHDPLGRGQYGARSVALLGQSELRAGLSQVPDEVAAPYLLSKRLRKGEFDVARSIVADQRGPELEMQARRVLSPKASSQVLSFIESGTWRRRSSPPKLGHTVHRLRHPVGAWIAVGGPESGAGVDLLAARFGRFLPHSVIIRSSAGWWERLRSLYGTRWRPGLVFQASARGFPGIRPDLCLEEWSGVDQAARSIVSGLSHRLARR